jgi:uncharacterized protein YqjF (DUF2071 family)
MPSTFLTAEWRKLIMAQYAVEPETLAPWLPAGLELDLFHGECFVSLVGFLFDRVRIKGVAIPFHTRFEEVNLRFYVRRREADGSVKRGVVFIREFVSLPAIALVANALYEEPYATLPTRSSISEKAQALSVRYDWRQGKTWHSLAVEAEPTAQPIETGSEAEFITEHYFGYTRRRASRNRPGSTSEYAVEHPRWQIYPVLRQAISVDLGALYGPVFSGLDAGRPASILLAEGSAVSVSSGTRVRG